MKLEEDGDMEAHMNVMLDLVDQLTTLGEEMADHLVVALLLCSLPNSYDTLITALETRPEKDLTIELVKGKLLQEYKRRQETLVGNTGNELVLNVKNVCHTLKGTCYYCGKPGHFKRDCMLLKGKYKHHKLNQATENTPEVDTPTIESSEYCFGVTNLYSGDWYVDSGATCHMTNNINFFSDLDSKAKDKIFLANGSVLEAKGIGEGSLMCNTGQNKFRLVTIKEVLYVPNLEGSLLSVPKLSKIGFTVKFKQNKCQIIKDDKIIAIAKSKGHLFQLDTMHSGLSAYESKPTLKCIHTWHRRLGHRNPDAIRLLVNKNLAEGVHLQDCNEKITCDSCVRGKMSRKPFPQKSNNRATRVLGLIHTDICGPMQTETPGRKRYMITFIDDFTRYSIVYLLEKKSDAILKLKEYVQAAQTKFGWTPKIIRSDGGGEYTGEAFRAYLKERGIEYQVSAPYSPQQNGVAERKNRSLVEMMRCMLLESKMTNKYWGEAIHTANYLQNRLPTKANDKTPYELWHDKIPNLEHIRVFGSIAYAMVPKEKRKKLDVKANKLTLVGYAEGAKAYRLLDTETNKITISRDVTFLEEIEINKDDHNRIDQVREDNVVHVELSSSDDNEIKEEDQLVRRSQRTNKGQPPKRYALKTTILNQEEPRNRNEALASYNSENWQAAMREEIESLHENKTWKLVTLPKERNLIGSKWVFKQKQNSDGETYRYKARLVAQGFSQKFGDDYDAVFAPVVRQTTLRILLVIAKERQMHVQHFDMKTAFLNADLMEEIYMKQPEGFEEPGKEDMVCKLEKSIYGLKQAARTWNQKLNEVLIEYGFRRGQADTCLYTKGVDSEWICLLVYVDDVIIAGVKQGIIDQARQMLEESFQMSCLGDLKYYLGIEIEKNDEGFYLLCQKSYICRLLSKFGLEDSKISRILMDHAYIKCNDNRVQLPDNELYRAAIGSLLYIAINTRPDIAISISILSRKISCPTQADWTEVKRVMRYLKGTQDIRLKMDNVETDDCELTGYVDADWGGQHTDRKSNSGYIFKLKGATISWASKKQTCVSLSSTEAEYVAMTEACQEAKWLKNLLNDFDVDTIKPIKMFEDNQSCLKLLEEGRINPRTKHIDIKFHFIRDSKEKGEIEFIYCPTGEMLADIMTKPLHNIKLNYFMKQIGLAQ